MSFIVMGMEMPKDCDSCWIPGNFCNLRLKADVKTRHSDCPFRPLPEKHGRIGDLDEIMNKLIKDRREAFTKHYVWLMLSHYGAETIVEPEGK